MREQSRNGGRVITHVEELSPGSVKKFWIICEKYRVDGFLVNERGNFHAYVNRCRHMPTPLDFIRDQFVSDDGKYLMCYTHGASVRICHRVVCCRTMQGRRAYIASPSP